MGRVRRCLGEVGGWKKYDKNIQNEIHKEWIKEIGNLNIETSRR